MTEILHNHRSTWLRLPARRRNRQIILLFILFLAVWRVGFAGRSLAQSDEDPWTTPVNVSRSGGASQPAIAVAPGGKLHVLWWDSIEGEQYVQTTSVTETAWSEPVLIPQIVGARTLVRDIQTGEETVRLDPPLDVRMVSDMLGNVHAFWRDVDNQLLHAQNRGAGWVNVTALAEPVLVMDVATDATGVLHLVYVRSLSALGSPPGIYYRTTTGGAGWSAPALVYASPYFRTAEPEQAHISVAGESPGDRPGQVLVAWDDPELGHSLYAHSGDGGRTWSDPQAVGADQADQVTRARVAHTPQGDLFLFWPVARVGGCGLSQRYSSDDGQTWGAPERILTGLTRCPGRWRFVPGGDGRLWLVGVPLPDTAGAQSSLGVLAAWDGEVWSEPVNVGLSFQDAETGRTVNLNCLDMALTGQSIGVAGCGTGGDVWATRNAVGLESLMPELKPVWATIETLSRPESLAEPRDVPALATDEQGKLYAMWSESPAEGEPGTALYIAVWDANRWSRAVSVLQSTRGSMEDAADASLTAKVGQPALALDGQGWLHIVWSGGASGQTLYSRTYARNVTLPQGWAEPVALPAPTQVGSWPDILADPRGDVLHVIYAVPYNEQRGIYYVRSNDNGATWLGPTTVFDAVAARWESVDKPRLALDARANVLHAVWLRAVLPGGAGARAVMYARSSDGGQAWSVPLQVAEGAVDWPRVAVAGEEQVHLVWNQAPSKAGSAYPSEVWGRFSPDGGQRWTGLVQVHGFEDVSGPVGLASDGAGRFYLVGVGRTAGGESGLLCAQWDGQTWGGQDVFGLGQDAAPGNAASAALIPKAGQLSAVLREFVKAPDGDGQFEIVAMGRTVAVAPAAEPAPTFTPLPASTPTSTAAPSPTATARPQLPQAGAPQQIEGGPIQGLASLAAGAVLVAMIVLGVIVGQAIRIMRR